MGHEEVVLQGLPVETERLPAPAAPRARLARLAGLAVPPTRGRRFEEPEHLRARDGFERARRRPARGHDAEDATRLGGREGREAKPGSFHYFYNVMPRIDEIFGLLVIRGW